jgi:hypothetical protein
MLSVNHRSSTDTAGGEVVFLYDIDQRISTMLFYALQLSGYAPMEISQQQVLLRRLRVHPSAMTPVAVICDMATTPDPDFLRQMVAADPCLTVLGIADRQGTVHARIWAEWVPLSLPRSFRVRMLLDLLRRERIGSPQGTTG